MLDLHWLYAASFWWLCVTLPRAARIGNEWGEADLGSVCMQELLNGTALTDSRPELCKSDCFWAHIARFIWHCT